VSAVRNGVQLAAERDRGQSGWTLSGRPSTPASRTRIYDYLLGGKDNYAADRIAGEALIAAYPTTAELARANRAFLGRAVRYLAGEAGIRQFLDIGTGIPAAGNTHQVAGDRSRQPRRLRRLRPGRAGARPRPAGQQPARRHRLHRRRCA
jgi:hypothetical protein